jgi:hypothetical protein
MIKSKRIYMRPCRFPLYRYGCKLSWLTPVIWRNV